MVGGQSLGGGCFAFVRRAIEGMKSWRGAVCAGLLTMAPVGIGAEPALEAPPSPWDFSGTIRAGGGYKDNILLDKAHSEESPFTFAGADLFLIRAPVDNWEFNSIISADDRRYWKNQTVDKEQLFFGSLGGKVRFFDLWKAGLTTQYFYNDQVFDASVTEQLPIRVRAQSHRFMGTPLLELDLPGKRRFELTFPIARQEFEDFLDSSWELGPKLLFAQKYGSGSELTLSAQLRYRNYDKRGAPDEFGVGTSKSLTFEEDEFEIGLRHVWDAQKHWKSRLRLGLELNHDNGSGYFDYRKHRISKELSFTKGGFEGTLQCKFLHYEYLRQQAFSEPTARRRTELDFSLRLQQAISKRFNLFVESEYERVLATDSIERYHALTVWGGIEWNLD
jgi:hypothetical protein